MSRAEIKAYLAKIGRKGGKSKKTMTPAAIEARRANLAKGRAVLAKRKCHHDKHNQ